MNILLVEDDEDKRNQLKSFLSEIKNAEIADALSLQTALKLILNKQFDLIILDMSLTTFDKNSVGSGGRPQPFGGREILSQMQRKKIKSKVIVVTQYDVFNHGKEIISLYELNNQLFALFPEIYKGAVYYSVSISGWQEALTTIIKQEFSN